MSRLICLKPSLVANYMSAQFSSAPVKKKNDVVSIYAISNWDSQSMSGHGALSTDITLVLMWFASMWIITYIYSVSFLFTFFLLPFHILCTTLLAFLILRYFHWLPAQILSVQCPCSCSSSTLTTWVLIATGIFEVVGLFCLGSSDAVVSLPSEPVKYLFNLCNLCRLSKIFQLVQDFATRGRCVFWQVEWNFVSSATKQLPLIVFYVWISTSRFIFQYCKSENDSIFSQRFHMLGKCKYQLVFC